MRQLLKRIVTAIASAAVFPRVVAFYVFAPIIGADRALEGSTQSLARVPGLRGQYLRRAFLPRVRVACHPTAAICYGTVFSKVGARIDEDVYVGPRCHLGLVHIERDVLLAAGVHVPSGGRLHGTADLDRPIREQPGEVAMVRIGAGTWVGSTAVILADVGRNCIVGAGAVVTRPVPDNSVVGGVPARVLRMRGAQPAPSA
jgi:virginiamycin A acetyltransferase